MTFRRGATLPVAATLGHAESCNIGPTAGNGFYKRWPDDLALLSELGVSDLRITFDWARLQPKPGEIAGAWVERYENMFGAAEAIGISVWGTMYDAGIPKWFENEGGLDDDDAVIRWWPRWVERIADRFGDVVDGWIPFAVIPNTLPVQVWADTWGILEGGDPPVVASVQAADGFAVIGRDASVFNRLGVAIDTQLDTETEPSNGELDEAAERWGQALHDAAEAVPDRPLMVSEFTPHHDSPDVGGRIVGRFVEVVDAAIADGIDVTCTFIDPAIAGPDSPLGLLDKDRVTQPTADAFF